MRPLRATDAIRATLAGLARLHADRASVDPASSRRADYYGHLVERTNFDHTCLYHRSLFSAPAGQ